MVNFKTVCKALIIVFLFQGIVRWEARSALVWQTQTLARKEKAIKSRAVKLFSPRGSCSGVQVRAGSGKDYILSAGHCLSLSDEQGSIMVQTEDKQLVRRKVIKVDIERDLLLIEGLSNVKGLPIAWNYPKNKHVRTFTHGRGFDTYKTEGFLIQQTTIFLGELGLIDEEATTANVVPGSSGGMVVDDSGQVIGIVSAGDNVLGFLVTLDNIHYFLFSK